MESDAARRLAGINKLADVLLYIFYVSLALAPAALIFDVIEYNLIVAIGDGTQAPALDITSRIEASDRHQTVMGWTQVAIVVTSSILWLVWVFKSNKLARALGANDMKYSPGWSVGWYFVPILNFFHPYLAMKEIYLATLSPDDFDTSRDPSAQPESLNFVGLWWLFWILDGFVSKASFRYSSKAETIPELIFSSKLLIASELVGIATVLTSILLVKRVWAMPLTRLRMCSASTRPDSWPLGRSIWLTSPVTTALAPKPRPEK